MINKLKICFIGIGSIAKRHIKNMVTICIEDKIELEIDVLRNSDYSLPNDINNFISHIYFTHTNVPNDYDIIFITNPTDLHLATLKQVHDKAKHFFIEKPITSYKKIHEVKEIFYRKESIYYVACPLRFTNVIQYLKANIEISDIVAVRCISSSYLPDWRPGIDYRKTYSAHKNMGGGVSIDLIHEWDYIQYLFGQPESIFYTSGKKSKLEIDSDDYAVYVAEYNDKIIELHLDYFGRKTIRELMLFTTEDTIIGDLINSKIIYMKKDKTINLYEERNDYHVKELRYFLRMIDGKVECDNTIMQACTTIKYAQGVMK
ncbi:Gfo/Idh/MocA family oxidoreductase [[Clostridium] innocuum]|nr:Gfo/Idh/MocA family oxidoreductase [[Clostridium] innocuum]